MAQDLFSCDLDALTFADVEGFVALGIQESLRVDYKEQVPATFGDTATAFGSAVGGIVILGVQNHGGLPGAIDPAGREHLAAIGGVVARVEEHVADRGADLARRAEARAW